MNEFLNLFSIPTLLQCDKGWRKSSSFCDHTDEWSQVVFCCCAVLRKLIKWIGIRADKMRNYDAAKSEFFIRLGGLGFIQSEGRSLLGCPSWFCCRGNLLVNASRRTSAAGELVRLNNGGARRARPHRCLMNAYGRGWLRRADDWEQYIVCRSSKITPLAYHWLRNGVSPGTYAWWNASVLARKAAARVSSDPTVMVPAQLKWNETKTGKQVPFRVDEITLFQPSHCAGNETLKPFTDRQSPHAKLHVWNSKNVSRLF